MRYKYYELSILLKGCGIQLDATNLQYYLVAKRCCLLPMFFDDDGHNWYCSIAAFDEFMEFLRTQREALYNQEDIILLNKIDMGLDLKCPFDFTELGSLFKLGALQGFIKKSGPYKRKKQIYAESYWALISFQEAVYKKYRDQFDLLKNTVYH